MLDVRTLGEAIEAADRNGRREFVTAARSLAPQLEPDLLDAGGALAAFSGAGSPLSEASGLGMNGPVTAADVERITAFYARRNAPARIAIAPLTPPAVSELLARAGYVPVEFHTALAARIAELAGVRDPRIVECLEPDDWGRANAQGFLDGLPSERDVTIGSVIASIPAVTALHVRIGGVTVATGAMAIEGAYAALFAASTVPGARRSGWQAALILDRLARARERGAQYAHAFAALGSGSERNFLRAGFHAIYTRTVWERPLA